MAHVKALHSRQKIKSEKTVVSTGFVIIVLIIIALSLFYLRFKVEGLRIGYEISRNNKISKDLLKEHRILESEFMMAKSPDKLELKALELGFKYPTQEDIIYIEETVTVKGR